MKSVRSTLHSMTTSPRVIARGGAYDKKMALELLEFMTDVVRVVAALRINNRLSADDDMGLARLTNSIAACLTKYSAAILAADATGVFKNGMPMDVFFAQASVAEEEVRNIIHAANRCLGFKQ